MWYNQAFEDLVDEALVTEGSEARMDLYAQAEQILVYEDAVMAPIYWYTSVQMSKINIERTFSVMGGKESFNKWDFLPEGEERQP
jgi:oligopeptide transport system substrate-binding protein